MISFKNDYSEGMHPAILQALAQHNHSQEEGYGLDQFSQTACDLIQKQLQHPSSQVFLLSAGTQTNLVAIASILRPFEACIAASSGHIATHEAGAIEATGHKILTVPTDDGKLTPSMIEPLLIQNSDEHTVSPKLIYISNPTEWGTVYSLDELKRLYSFTNEHDLILYCDGARLGQTLIHPDTPISLSDYARYTDGFFIGGTKNGALLGEALVLNRVTWHQHLRCQLKQRGALLAKGRLLGITFSTFFTNELYEKLARQALERAMQLRDGLLKLDISFRVEPSTNQLFPILPHAVITLLQKDFGFYVWEPATSEESVVRLMTSWASTPEQIASFLASLEKAMQQQPTFLPTLNQF